MFRPLANLLLSFLLAATLLWGGCVSCEQFFMIGSSAKSCCAPDGHCRTRTTPSRSDLSKECKQLAFEHSKFLDHGFVPVASQSTLVTMPAIADSRAQSLPFAPIEPSPPDLQTLYSTFLI
jgi:hypothetical protein